MADKHAVMYVFMVSPPVDLFRAACMLALVCCGSACRKDSGKAGYQGWAAVGDGVRQAAHTAWSFVSSRQACAVVILHLVIMR